VAMIQDILADFPFDCEASRANAVAMLLLPIVRPLITGPTPLAAIVAPQAGTGKSMLASICAILATGHNYLLPWKREERENEVTISAAMLAQQTVMVLDNVVGILGSGVLCSALTSANFQGRVMGSSTMFNVPVTCTWIATANNLRLGDDMSRRVYKIRMDAKSSKPMQREGFRHPRLLDYVTQHRGELVHALLIIARYWFCLGCPRARVVPLGSFESWHVVMASILKAAGIDGFMGNLQEVLGKDEAVEQWTTFMEALSDTFDGIEFRVSDVVSKCSDPLRQCGQAAPDDRPAVPQPPGDAVRRGRIVFGEGGQDARERAGLGGKERSGTMSAIQRWIWLAGAGCTASCTRGKTSRCRADRRRPQRP
jgi:hypothetical protein